MDANRNQRRSEQSELTRPPDEDYSYLTGPEELDDATGDPELCRCGSCGSMLVQPIDWSLIGRTHWRVVLRCPNCEWCGTGVFGQEAVDRFDCELDRGMRKLQARSLAFHGRAWRPTSRHFARRSSATRSSPSTSE